ncbi:PepSY domain-containing protein [Sphingobium sp.]|uniref:PepSY domain-containing protein n=1 Tax=Sphingobium sp. TaxID=1912891 RepID=UPI003BB644BD
MPASRGKAPALGQKFKRWLYIIHRWIGIASCLLFAIWFLSGLVMIYVPFPSLTAQERVQGQDSIDWRRVTVQPAEALATAGVTGPRSMTLEMRDASPIWRIEPWDGNPITVPASHRDVLSIAQEPLARRVAQRFGGAQVLSIERIERDQWTVAGGFDRHRPLWKVALADPAATELYVSSTTGGVVQNSDREERFWNWLGSVPHWIYFTILRQDNAVWRQVVMWVSGPCIAAAVTGMWIGLLRARFGRRRFRDGRITPYRGWMWWHHVAGLTGGVALLAWIFSGWLSVDPFRFFDSPGIGNAERFAYAGAAAPLPIEAATLAGLSSDAKQLTLNWAAGHEMLTWDQAGKQVTIDARTLQAPRWDQALLVQHAAKLVPNAHIVSVQRLTESDAYWYEIGALPRLPVLRMTFDDTARTWVHIDPATGMILGTLDAKGRLYRWCFDLLHKWDMDGLTLHRPAWDILLWMLSALGLTTSVTGIWIGWKRLTHSRVRKRLS